MRIILACLVLCLFPSVMVGQTPAASIEAMLKKRIDEEKKGVGIVVGVIDGNETTVVGYGRADADGALKLDGTTLLEIGSVSKVLTSLLLADMVAKGEVSLDDPISKYLPPNVASPKRDGKEITLEHLATHTSSLPRMPRLTGRPADVTRPFAEYTEDQLYAFVAQHRPMRGIGERFEYSNLGVALLGNLLARKAGKPYEELVLERVCAPLGMEETRIELPADLASRTATGFDETGDPVKGIAIGAMSPSGAFRSSTNDMLRLLAAALHPKETPLAAAFAEMVVPRAATERPSVKIGLAWFLRDDGAVWHNGSTTGFRSFIGFNPTTGRGVVVLSNATFSVDDIGFMLLNDSLPGDGEPRSPAAKRD